MPLRVTEIRMPLGGDESGLVPRALKRARLDPAEVASVELVRKSMDRRRSSPEFVYSFDFHLIDPARIRAALGRGGDRRVFWVEEPESTAIRPGDEPLRSRPVVIGAGPGGLFAALVLARAGFRPRVFERGSRMNRRVGQIATFNRDRVLDPESNYLFGEGGAGTFSDGKLTTRSRDPRARLVLDEFRRKSGLESVGTYYRPHLGSDRVRTVVARIRREVEELGGEFHHDCRVDALEARNGRVVGLIAAGQPVAAEVVIAATGHSARDFYRMIAAAGVLLEPKPFQMGFRIEHDQEFVDRCIYGRPRGELGLGPADYRLVAQIEDRGVFSFCMCPGGEIIPAIHDRGHFNTNGMSYFSKDTGYANSGVVTTIQPEDFEGSGPFAGLELQMRYEARAAELAGDRFLLPAQRLEDFLADRPSLDLPGTSCRTGTVAARVGELAPPWLTALVRQALGQFERQMPGYGGAGALICGPEARSSSPIRIVRDPESLESVSLAGFLPVGEGAGHAGGIVSAAVDGWRAAETVLGRFAPPRG
ncbi:MAG: NAD(P)-binding protein [Planctomycetes bacterium]|nr:NAD(P)-binding protein [Planctomycetota bacterium]